MAQATMEDFAALAAEVVTFKHPIPPHPEWGQDAALIAFIIDRTRGELAYLREMLTRTDQEMDERLTASRDEITKLRLIVRHLLDHGAEWTLQNLGEPYHALIEAIAESGP